MLEELVVYLRAAREARASAWALVVTSSEALEKEVLEALVGSYGEVDIVDVSKGEDPRFVVQAMLASPTIEATRTSVVTGLSVVLASQRGDELLTWLNFHREDFERPAGVFLFMLQTQHAASWQRLAPDLDRYTQHFDFMDWDDLVADAERAAEHLQSEGASLSDKLERAELRLETLRAASPDVLAKALVEVGRWARATGSFSRAQRVLSEARSLTEVRSNLVHVELARESAILFSHLGHPADALQSLEQLRAGTALDVLRGDIAGERFATGQARRALTELEASLASSRGDLASLRYNAVVVGQWVGEVQTAMRRLREETIDMSSPGRLDLQARSWMMLASLLIDVGAMAEALDPLMKSLRLSAAVGSDQTRIFSMTNLLRATFAVGRPVRSLALFEGVGTSAAWRSARSYGLAIVRAEVSWAISGPSGVLPVVRDERERQRGWKAPIPAAELAYVRALASVHDDEARRLLQDAADHFRALEGFYYLSELERRLAHLDRFGGELDRAAARVQEGLEWHVREGLRPREARDRTELSMIALARGDAESALETANRALELIQACGTRTYEPAALVALAAAERALGHHDTADAHDRRWRRLVRGMAAKGLEADLARDAAWARDVAAR